MRTHLLIPQRVYQRKARVWQAWTRWHVRVVCAFFPDTGGSLHLMHNWYRCAEKANPAGVRLADWVYDLVWDRVYRITHKLDAQHERHEHMLKHGDHFRPLWCRFYQSNPNQN